MRVLSSCLSLFDFGELRLVFLSFFLFCCPRLQSMTLLQMLLWSAHYIKCCCSFVFPTHLPFVLSQFIGNDLVRHSSVVFTCLGMMDALLFLSSVPFYTTAVREGKSSTLMREVTLFKVETSLWHTRPLIHFMLHKHMTHIYIYLISQ